MNNNNISIATSIDAMKAVDTVNHNILLKKAKKYGIVGQVLQWLRNYRSDRFQCTLANNIVSNIEPIYMWCSSRQCIWTFIVFNIY